MAQRSVGFLLWVLLIGRMVESALYVPVLIDGEEEQKKYDSKPAQFGRTLESHKMYHARLQFLSTDPYLCGGHQDGNDDDDDDDDDVDVQSQRMRISKLEAEQNGDDSGVIVPTDGIPVAILARRGSCSFARKAAEATRLNAAVQYLLVYDDKAHQPLVPMSANGDTSGAVNVAALFVSLDTGRDLFRWLKLQTAETAAAGGFVFSLDGTSPVTPSPSPSRRRSNNSKERRREEWMIATLASLFMLLSCVGTVLLCAHAGYLHTDGNVIFIGRRLPVAAEEGEGQGGQGGGGGGQRRRRPRRVLNRQQVMELPAMQYPPQAVAMTTCAAEEPLLSEETTTTTLSSSPQVLAPLSGITTCSICLEEFGQGDDILLLHCQHYFHTQCIVPWLTRRSSSCPLCKADMLPPGFIVEEPPAAAAAEQQAASAPETTTTTLLTQLRLFLSGATWPPLETETPTTVGNTETTTMATNDTTTMATTTTTTTTRQQQQGGEFWSWMSGRGRIVPQNDSEESTTTSLETPLLSQDTGNRRSLLRREEFRRDLTRDDDGEVERHGSGGAAAAWWRLFRGGGSRVGDASPTQETRVEARRSVGDVELLIQEEEEGQGEGQGEERRGEEGQEEEEDIEQGGETNDVLEE